MLSDFLSAKKLDAKIIDCGQPVQSVRQACGEMKCAPEEIIKSILFIDGEKNAFLAIVLGNDRISEKKLTACTKTEGLRIASEKEVFNITGYEIGGVPPISIFGVKTIIDKKVMQKTIVTGGGGDETHLLQLSTKELLENSVEATVEEIAE